MNTLSEEIEQELARESLNGGRNLRSETCDVLLKLMRATAQRDPKLSESLLLYAAAVGAGTEDELRRISQMPNLSKDVAKLPIFNIHELAADYRRFTREHSDRRYDICRWLPGLKVRPLVPGECVVVLGATGVGKTALAQNFAISAAPLPVLMFQLELPRTLLLERYVSMKTGIEGEDIHRAFENDLEPQWHPETLEHIWTCDRSGLQPAQVGELIVNSRDLMIEKPVVVIIDYIQLVNGRGDRRSRVSDAVEEFKKIAKNTETIFIVVSQIARDEKDEKEIPGLYDGKESGSIENTAGLVLGVGRKKDDHTKLLVKVLKNTKGKAGRKITCTYDFPSMRITEDNVENELI